MSKQFKQLFKKSLIALAAAVTASASVAGGAQAATFIRSINFAGAGQDASSLFFDLGRGLELTVTAGVHSGGAGANAPLTVTRPANVTQTGGFMPGLGVRSGRFDTSELDAGGPDEFLRFTFNRKVTLLSTIFDAAIGNDEFDLGIDGVDVGVNNTFGTDRLRSFPNAIFPGGTDRRVNFSAGVDFNGDGSATLFPATGSVFDFYTDDKYDSYRIRGIKVAASVPEPASALALLTFATVAVGSVLKKKAST